MSAITLAVEPIPEGLRERWVANVDAENADFIRVCNPRDPEDAADLRCLQARRAETAALRWVLCEYLGGDLQGLDPFRTRREAEAEMKRRRAALAA